MKKVLYIFLLCLVQVGCSDSGPQSDSVIVNFKTYNFETRNVSRINGGFLLVTSSSLVRLNEGGDIVATFPLKEDSMRISSTNQVHHASQAFETNDKGFMIINSIVTVDQKTTNGARDSVQIDLELIKLTGSFEKEWSRIILIESIEQSEEARNTARNHYLRYANFYLNFNNYGFASQDNNGDYYLAFCHDSDNGTRDDTDNRTRFKLLRLNSVGELLNQRAFDSGDFYSRVYAFQLFNDELFLSRGGRNWARFERYTKDLEVIHSVISHSQFADPAFTNITKGPNGDILFTGHADSTDENNRLITNFECLVARQSETGDIKIQFVTDRPTKDLCFGSTLNGVGNVVMVCIRRDVDQVFEGSDSDLILTFADSGGKVAEEVILSEDQGLEGLYIQAIGKDSYTIIGNRTVGHVNTFLMRIDLRKLTDD